MWIEFSQSWPNSPIKTALCPPKIPLRYDLGMEQLRGRKLGGGNALAFAQVVTQVRSIDDTTLKVKGAAAHKWMSITQCFASTLENPPIKGTKLVRS